MLTGNQDTDFHILSTLPVEDLRSYNCIKKTCSNAFWEYKFLKENLPLLMIKKERTLSEWIYEYGIINDIMVDVNEIINIHSVEKGIIKIMFNYHPDLQDILPFPITVEDFPDAYLEIKLTDQYYMEYNYDNQVIGCAAPIDTIKTIMIKLYYLYRDDMSFLDQYDLPYLIYNINWQNYTPWMQCHISKRIGIKEALIHFNKI